MGEFKELFKKWLAGIGVFCLPTVLSLAYAAFVIIIVSRVNSYFYIPILFLATIFIAYAIYVALKKVLPLLILPLSALPTWIPLFISDHYYSQSAFHKYEGTHYIAIYYSIPLFVVLLVLTIKDYAKIKKSSETTQSPSTVNLNNFEEVQQHDKDS